MCAPTKKWYDQAPKRAPEKGMELIFDLLSWENIFSSVSYLRGKKPFDRVCCFTSRLQYVSGRSQTLCEHLATILSIGKVEKQNKFHKIAKVFDATLTREGREDGNPEVVAAVREHLAAVQEVGEETRAEVTSGVDLREYRLVTVLLLFC